MTSPNTSIYIYICLSNPIVYTIEYNNPKFNSTTLRESRFKVSGVRNFRFRWMHGETHVISMQAATRDLKYNLAITCSFLCNFGAWGGLLHPKPQTLNSNPPFGHLSFCPQALGAAIALKSRSLAGLVSHISGGTICLVPKGPRTLIIGI